MGMVQLIHDTENSIYGRPAYSRGGHYIFALRFLLLVSFPRLISAVADWMSTILDTSTHRVAIVCPVLSVCRALWPNVRWHTVANLSPILSTTQHFKVVVLWLRCHNTTTLKCCGVVVEVVV